jgi:hypothetical protein
LPVGQISNFCQALLKKIFRFPRRANQRYQLAPSFPGKRGVSRSSRTRDGMWWTRQRRRASVRRAVSVSEQRRAGRTTPKRTAKPCGPDARCWRQVRGGFVSPTGSGKTVNPLTTVTRRIRRRGEHGISRKTIAQGRRIASAEPVCSCAFSFVHVLHTRPRVQRAPGFPCALCLSRNNVRAKLRARRAARTRRRVGGCLKFESENSINVIARSESDEAIQTCFAARWIASLRSQ